MPKVPGLVKGLGVTFGTMVKTLKDGPATTRYPHEREIPTARARGVITLYEENCTACMLCARECPDWCIYIEAHKYLAPPRRAAARTRSSRAPPDPPVPRPAPARNRAPCRVHAM